MTANVFFTLKSKTIKKIMKNLTAAIVLTTINLKWGNTAEAMFQIPAGTVVRYDSSQEANGLRNIQNMDEALQWVGNFYGAYRQNATAGMVNLLSDSENVRFLQNLCYGSTPVQKNTRRWKNLLF